MREYNRIIDYIEHWAIREPDHCALIYNQRRISYEYLYNRAYQCAQILIKMGFKPGDRIAYLFDCRPEFFYLYLGASMIGVVVSGINPRSCAKEIHRIMGILQPDLLIFDAKYFDKISLISARKNCMEITDFFSFPSERGSLSKVDAYREKIHGETPLFIIFTSGTTGEPKGAVLTQRSILTSVKAQIREFGAPVGLSMTDVIQHQIPICHVSGAVQWGVAPLIAGCTMILHERFFAESIIRDTEKYRATILAGVPSMWEMMFRMPELGKYDLSSVRWCMTGAAQIGRSLAERIFDICGNVSNPLGMTETSGFCSMFQGDSTLEKIVSTVGKIIPEIDYQIIGDGEKRMEIGEIGQLAYKGPSIIPRYLQFDLPKSREGYFLTNDLCFKDQDGYIHLCGRKDDMFTVGGYNVYPEEIEKLLLSYPNIGNAVVVPKKHSSMGNVCRAIIVPANKEEPVDIAGLQRFLDNNIIYYKIPRDIVIAEQLPINALGKIDRMKCMQLS